MEPAQDGGRARRQQRAIRTRIGAAVAAGVGFGAAVAGFAVHDHATTPTTEVTSTDAATTPTTSAPSVDPFDRFDQFGTAPGVGGGAPDSTSRGS